MILLQILAVTGLAVIFILMLCPIAIIGFELVKKRSPWVKKKQT
jgi:hypothetical protein